MQTKSELGNVYGRLSALAPVINRRQNGTYWLCLCECGRTKVIKGSSLRSGTSRSCGCLTVEKTAQRAAAMGMARRKPLTYATAHKRLATTKGPASEYDCVDCGNGGQDWSWTGEPGGFSDNPDDYVARCKSCHKTHDNALREVH